MIVCLINNAIIGYKELNDIRLYDASGDQIHFEMLPYFEPIMMIQTIVFIPHMNVLMSDETISYYRAMRHLLFSFSFIPHRLQDSNKQKNNTYLYLIGIESNKSWVNMFNVYAIL